MADLAYTHRRIRDRVSAAICIIFAAYMGYLAHRDGVALAPSVFYGIIAFVLLAVVLMVLRSFIYALIIAALIVWIAARMDYTWAREVVDYIDQLLRLGYHESLKLFLSAERPINA